jgi:hypothetical protein
LSFEVRSYTDTQIVGLLDLELDPAAGASGTRTAAVA